MRIALIPLLIVATSCHADARTIERKAAASVAEGTRACALTTARKNRSGEPSMMVAIHAVTHCQEDQRVRYDLTEQETRAYFTPKATDALVNAVTLDLEQRKLADFTEPGR
jgi:hypothetical protein